MLKGHTAGAVVICQLLSVVPAVSDSPPPAPSDWDAWSPNKQCLAHADLKANKIFILRANGDDRRVLWSLSPWQNTYFGGATSLSDDCENFVVWGWPGIGPDLDQPILTFYHQGALVRTVLLHDLFTEPSKLQHSVSHYIWQTGDAHLEGNILVVSLVDGRRAKFDLASGQFSFDNR